MASLISSTGSLFLKHSRTQEEGFLSPYFLSGLACYGINVFLFSRALNKIPISSAYPVFAGLSFLLIALLSKTFLGEELHLSQWIGLGVILFGIYLVIQ